MSKEKPALFQLQRCFGAVFHLFMQPTWRTQHQLLFEQNLTFKTFRVKAPYCTKHLKGTNVKFSELTSDDELLSVDSSVSFGALQQGDPVVHLLGRVGVAMQHAVCRDNDKRVWSGTRNIFG